MAFRRTSLADFALANTVYAGATLTVYGVLAGAKDTTNKPTLYDAITGTGTLANPQVLDSEGKFNAPVYVDEATILQITGLSIGDHDSGIIYPSAASWDYESGELAMTADTALVQAHGLSAIPKAFEAVARCKTTDGGYAVGDEIRVGAFHGHGAADTGGLVMADATNIQVIQGSALKVLGKATFNTVTLTAANWKWVVRARLG